jgi:polyhydroxyalkanoate synthase
MNCGDQLAELRDGVSAATGRNVRRIVNGLRLAAGLDRPGVGGTPRTVAWSSGRARLMHYTAGADAGRPAVCWCPA